jgi:hypothetical protein
MMAVFKTQGLHADPGLWQLRQQSNHQIASAKALKVAISEKNLQMVKGNKLSSMQALRFFIFEKNFSFLTLKLQYLKKPKVAKMHKYIRGTVIDSQRKTKGGKYESIKNNLLAGHSCYFLYVSYFPIP